MKSQFIISVILLIPLLASCASKQTGPCSTNLEPMYGGENRPAQCKAMEGELLTSVDAKGLDRAASSTEVAKLGFEYMTNGDMSTAIKRFNQAWLLDPNNCMPFNGFGIIKHTRDHDTDEAIRMFDMGLARCPGNGLLMSDYGRMLEESNLLAPAVSMFEKSLQFLPTNLEAYKGLVRAHIQLGNDEACLGAIKRGQAYGLAIDHKLIEELERRVKQTK